MYFLRFNNEPNLNYSCDKYITIADTHNDVTKFRFIDAAKTNVVDDDLILVCQVLYNWTLFPYFLYL